MYKVHIYCGLRSNAPYLLVTLPAKLLETYNLSNGDFLKVSGDKKTMTLEYEVPPEGTKPNKSAYRKISNIRGGKAGRISAPKDMAGYHHYPAKSFGADLDAVVNEDNGTLEVDLSSIWPAEAKGFRRATIQELAQRVLIKGFKKC